jgi:hypothetical protein
VDRNPCKQGKYPPGTHIPIFDPGRIGETRPDYLLILPWNPKDEIMAQLSGIGEWGAKFVVPIPEVALYDSPGKRVTDTGRHRMPATGGALHAIRRSQTNRRGAHK